MRGSLRSRASGVLNPRPGIQPTGARSDPPAKRIYDSVRPNKFLSVRGFGLRSHKMRVSGGGTMTSVNEEG